MPTGVVKQPATNLRPRTLLQSLVGPSCVVAAVLSLVSDKPTHAVAGTLLLTSGVLFSAVAIVDAAKSRKDAPPIARSERTDAGAVKF